MKNIFLFLISTLSICTTVLSSSDERRIDLRSISHTLVSLINRPLSTESLARVDYHLDDHTVRRAKIHPKSELQVVHNRENIQVLDTKRGISIWSEELQKLNESDPVSTTWDETGEKLQIWCAAGKRVIYRVSYESILQQLDAEQLGFIHSCNQFWINTKKPFLITHALYEIYQDLPRELHHNSLFVFADEIRWKARGNNCRIWVVDKFLDCCFGI